MKSIQQLSDHITDEIKDAHCYASLALELKDSSKDHAELYYTLAQEEMKHMDMLHTQVVKDIEKYRKEHGEPPADMMIRYNVLHELHKKDAREVKLLLLMYKEGDK